MTPPIRMVSVPVEPTGAKAVILNGQIVISIDVDALPLILSGSIALNAVAGTFKVTDPATFAKEVCHALNDEKEDGTTRVHMMFDSAFDHAIDQGAEGVEEISEDEFEVEAARLQKEAKAAMLTAAPVREEGGSVLDALDEALTYIEQLGANIERNDLDMHLDTVERPFSFAQTMRGRFPSLCTALATREEAQPVGVSAVDAKWLLDNYGPTSPRIERIATALLSTPPAPEAEKMRVAVEAIVERVKTGAKGSPVQALGALSDIEQLALAALQQEGRP